MYRGQFFVLMPRNPKLFHWLQRRLLMTPRRFVLAFAASDSGAGADPESCQRKEEAMLEGALEVLVTATSMATQLAHPVFEIRMEPEHGPDWKSICFSTTHWCSGS